MQHSVESSLPFQKVWMHSPPVPSFVELDPKCPLVVGYNSFPRPPENEGDSSFVGSQLIDIFIPNFPQRGTPVYEGDITILQPLQKESSSSASISSDEIAIATAKQLTISVIEVNTKATSIYRPNQAMSKLRSVSLRDQTSVYE